MKNLRNNSHISNNENNNSNNYNTKNNQKLSEKNYSKKKKINSVYNNYFKYAKNLVTEVSRKSSNDKVKNILNSANNIYDVASDGINAVDEAVNKGNYNQIQDWTKANITPRLKH